jgi:hypothetical protein
MVVPCDGPGADRPSFRKATSAVTTGDDPVAPRILRSQSDLQQRASGAKVRSGLHPTSSVLSITFQRLVCIREYQNRTLGFRRALVAPV